MQMTPVVSSNIFSIGYEAGTLYVAFNHGGLYAYSGVPVDVYRNLMAAASHGSYFAAHVKNRYPYTRLR